MSARPPRFHRARHGAIGALLLVTTIAVSGCAGAAPAAEPTPVASTPSVVLDPSSFQGLIDSPRETGALSVGDPVRPIAGEDAHAVTYESSGAVITGVLRMPRGDGPFPIAVVVHGSVDPETYESGRDVVPEQRALLDAGYAVLATDLRGYAGSDAADVRGSLVVDPGFGWDTVLDWTMALDVVAALDIVRSGTIEGVDPTAVALVGHSLGGLLAIDAALIAPGAADIVVAVAAPTTDLADALADWARGAEEEAAAAAYAARYSPRPFMDRARGPLVLVHGTDDPVAPIEWAESTRESWSSAGAPAQLIVIEGGDHHLEPRRDEADAQIVAVIDDALR